MSEDMVDGDGGGSGKMLLVLGLIAGVALGGGVGFVLFGGNSGDGAGEEAAVEEVEEEPKNLVAVNFNRLAVPIYVERGGRNRFVGNYFLDVIVEVDGEENQIKIKRSEAPVQHAIVSTISRQSFLKEGTTEVDYDKAAKLVRQAVESVMGQGIVERVSVTNVMRVSG